MKLSIILFILCLPFINVNAQTTFTEHLTEHKSNEGTIAIIQDERLTEAVNNGSNDTGAITVTAPEVVKKSPGIQTGKKVKVRGYRIQVFWGGNQRADQSKAQRIGAKVQALFPELAAYTTFESPHWRCRVGDFTEMEEAQNYLKKIRAANLSSDVTVVRSEIIVFK